MPLGLFVPIAYIHIFYRWLIEITVITLPKLLLRPGDDGDVVISKDALVTKVEIKYHVLLVMQESLNSADNTLLPTLPSVSSVSLPFILFNRQSCILHSVIRHNKKPVLQFLNAIWPNL